MRKLLSAPLRAGIFFLLLLISGCFGKDAKPERLYYEPPDRLIDDYTGMVEVQELNWAWLQPGFKLGNYKSLGIKPVLNLTGVEDSTVAQQVERELAAWFTRNGLSIDNGGQLSCEGAIVALKLDRSFTEKKFVFREKAADLFLEMEFVMKEMPAQNIICKIRHGVIASQSEQLAGQLISGLLSYFEAHR